MNSVIFVADFFKKDLLGGGESNDNVLINHLLSKDAQRLPQEILVKINFL